MRIELGAGSRAAAGFVAVDVNPRNADVIANATHLPFRDETIIALRAVDLLEHASWQQTDRVLAEWARICAPGAPLYVQVPDMLTICQWLASNDDRLLAMPDHAHLGRQPTHLAGAVWRLFGGHLDQKYAEGDDRWEWNAHNAGFSAESLRSALETAGFDVGQIKTNAHPNLCAFAVKR